VGETSQICRKDSGFHFRLFASQIAQPVNEQAQTAMTKAMTMIDRSVSFIREYSAAAPGADHMVSDAAQFECGRDGCIRKYSRTASA
jgi:hypothetical protein